MSEHEIEILKKRIAELEKAEVELRFYSEMMNNMAEGTYLIGADDGIIKYCNPKFEKIFGYEAGEMAGKHASIVNAPDGKDPKETAKEIMGVLEKTGEWHGEVHNIKKDGTKFWCYANCSLFQHPEYGRVIVAVHSDITERKKADEKIKESAEEWQRTFNSISDLIFIQNTDHTILRVNKAFAAALKMSPRDIVGKKCYELLHKTNSPWPDCPFERTKKDKATHIQEVDDANIGIPLLVTTSPVFNDRGELTGSVHVAKDITVIKEKEKELAKKMHDLEIFHKAAVGRELKMEEMRKRIKELEARGT